MRYEIKRKKLKEFEATTPVAKLNGADYFLSAIDGDKQFLCWMGLHKYFDYARSAKKIQMTVSSHPIDERSVKTKVYYWLSLLYDDAQEGMFKQFYPAMSHWLTCNTELSALHKGECADVWFTLKVIGEK